MRYFVSVHTLTELKILMLRHHTNVMLNDLLN